MSDHAPGERLPLRWLTILAVAISAGGVVGHIAGPVVGAGITIAVVSLLHKITA